MSNTKIVTPLLQGGLGNQLFQIATTYAYAKDHGIEFVLDDLSEECLNQGKSANAYRDTVYGKFKYVDFSQYEDDCNNIMETTYMWDELPKPKTYNKTIGYFQSWKYFFHRRAEILELFDFPDKYTLLLQKFWDDNGLGFGYTTLHIRRGDYAKFGNHPIIPFEKYYSKALKGITGKVVVVSDDIEWCKKTLKGGSRLLFCDMGDELFDLLLMTQATNNIIANSSFSWWGAYLNPNAQRVIAPMPWFADKTPTDDLIPVEWEILRYD